MYATDMFLHFVVKWEWSTPEGNADLFFQRESKWYSLNQFVVTEVIYLNTVFK